MSEKTTPPARDEWIVGLLDEWLRAGLAYPLIHLSINPAKLNGAGSAAYREYLSRKCSSFSSSRYPGWPS
jgi:hypothetical protein